MNESAENIRLQGFALIEASAGTGKTYTIQNLYLRLIAGWMDDPGAEERCLSVASILVMTYTVAATEELKARIRKILMLGSLYFENPSVLNAEDFARMDELLRESRGCLLPGQTQEERDRTIRSRIRSALLAFDDAAIYTIHGFCQRLLSQYAFESGILFNTEVRTDVEPMVRGLLDDYLRRFCYPADRPLYAALKRGVPASLSEGRQLTLTLNLITRPGLRVVGAGELSLPETCRKMEEILTSLKNEYPQGWPEYPVRDAPSCKEHEQLLTEWVREKCAAETSSEVLDFLLSWDRQLTRLNSDEKVSEETAALLNSRFAWLCRDLGNCCRNYSAAVSYDAALYVKEEFKRLKQRENFHTYDDLLNRVLDAIRESSNPLRNLVRKQYQAAIVDEFQDTDPVQYEIFQRIFGHPETGHILFFVGDPKQAIYGFRGGDIATYRTAREFVQRYGREYTLRRNFRSAEKLLAAVNDIFEKSPHNQSSSGETVFADDAIRFVPVIAGRKGPGLLNSSGEEDARPFQFCWLVPPEDGGLPTLNQMLALSCRACAEDIVELLHSDKRNPETGQRLRPCDIAVLVPDNGDARLMRDELKKRNVPCVIPRSENVFQSAAAKYLKTLFSALLNPADSSLVSEAMLTPVLGFTLDDLIGIHASCSRPGSADRLTEIQEKMILLAGIWRRKSFLSMFQEMLRLFEVRSTLLRRTGGERILTDLLQLRDLIQLKIMETGLSASGVLNFLAAQENDSDSEEKETLMETDRAAVVITTIHSSKGLEYPVVMLPAMFKKTFLYAPGRVECYHDDRRNLILNLSPDSAAQKLIEREKKQELMRLLYVALTRAEYSCSLYWGLIQGKSDNGLHDQTALDWLFPGISARDFRHLQQEIPQLEKCGRRVIAADQIQCTRWVPETGPRENLILRKWHGSIDSDFQFASFTAWTGGAAGSEDERDYDGMDSDNRVEKPVGIFKIPSGAQTGNAWHDIMEEIDFTSFDPVGDRDFIARKLEVFGVLNRTLPPETRREYIDLTLQMISSLLNTPLRNADGNLFALKQISRRERLSELKFNYRFRHSFRTVQLIPEIAAYVKRVFGLEESEINLRDLTVSGGYLNGAIDLLFRQDGKLYIADWKSNRINGQPDGFDASGLVPEMAAHSYYLQYLIYTVALLKYLTLHLGHPATEKEYDQLFGGVYYLFMRGADPLKPRRGVFYTRPSFALICSLEHWIG